MRKTQKAIYKCYSPNDCEKHFQCPVCNGRFGSLSAKFYIKFGKERCKCPECGSELISGF